MGGGWKKRGGGGVNGNVGVECRWRLEEYDDML